MRGGSWNAVLEQEYQTLLTNWRELHQEYMNIYGHDSESTTPRLGRMNPEQRERLQAEDMIDDVQRNFDVWGLGPAQPSMTLADYDRLQELTQMKKDSAANVG